jgi:hypothetical protein
MTNNTTRSALAYTSLIAAIVIPQVQKHWGITVTIDDIADGMAALALAWHGVSTFLETRWPAKSESNPAVIEAVTRAVLQEMKSSPLSQPTAANTSEKTS